MKKIILVFTVIGFLISCSNQKEIEKKGSIIDVISHQEKAETLAKTVETISVEIETIPVEIEKLIITNKDYNLKSRKQKKVIKKEQEPLKKMVNIPLNDIVDKDVDKKIMEKEKENKVVKTKISVEKSNKKNTIYAIIGIILLALGLFILKKKKLT